MHLTLATTCSMLSWRKIFNTLGQRLACNWPLVCCMPFLCGHWNCAQFLNWPKKIWNCYCLLPCSMPLVTLVLWLPCSRKVEDLSLTLSKPLNLWYPWFWTCWLTRYFPITTITRRFVVFLLMSLFESILMSYLLISYLLNPKLIPLTIYLPFMFVSSLYHRLFLSHSRLSVCFPSLMVLPMHPLSATWIPPPWYNKHKILTNTWY